MDFAISRHVVFQQPGEKWKDQYAVRSIEKHMAIFPGGMFRTIVAYWNKGSSI